MVEIFGKRYNRAELLRRVGNPAQIGGIREYSYTSGRADGVKAIEIDTGSLRYELLVSRCLDIAFASYRGIPFGYVSKSGIRHPAYFAKNDPTGFHDNFLGGVLTTCGLHNIGPAAEGGGRPHQLHGELANMPAEMVSLREEWIHDECIFSVEGEVRHSSFYHEDLVLRRKVSSRFGTSSLRIEDEIENRDFTPSPCIVLYHIQFGFPLLDVCSRLFTSPAAALTTRTGKRLDGDTRHTIFAGPSDGAEETCFYHDLVPDADGYAVACLFNPELGEKGIGVYIRYHTAALPVFVQWKMLRSREFVCGLEPASARLDGRDAGELAACMLQPLEKRHFQLELGVVEGEEHCRALVGEA